MPARRKCAEAVGWHRWFLVYKRRDDALAGLSGAAEPPITEADAAMMEAVAQALAAMQVEMTAKFNRKIARLERRIAELEQERSRVLDLPALPRLSDDAA